MEEEKKHIDELIATYLTEGLDKNALAELKAWICLLYTSILQIKG